MTERFHSNFEEARDASAFRIRPLDFESESEVLVVAERMRETLVEVLGETRGSSMYSMDWLCERVRTHRDPGDTSRGVYVVEDSHQRIAGHVMARTEAAEDGTTLLHFSTIFVEPRLRRAGLASSLVAFVERWARESRCSKIIYNTAIDHTAILGLFAKHGYVITHRTEEMVQLTKSL